MGHAADGLLDLMNLAGRMPEERRADLVGHVAELFLQAPERFNARELDQVSDILCLGVPHLSFEERAVLAERFALTPAAPRSFMCQLARDDIGVADPVLVQSAALTDEDLVAVVEECDETHQVAITLREELPEAVSHALVETGLPDVLISLAENTSANLSREDLAQMTAAAEHVPAMQLPLIDRDDVPADLLAPMFFFVSPVLRSRIVHALTSLSDAEAAELRAHYKNTPKPQLPYRAAVMLRETEPSEATLLEAVGKGDLDKFIILFASLCGLSLPMVQRVLTIPGAQALAVACKAAGLSREAFCALVLRTTRHQSVAKDAIEEALSLYEGVPDEGAKRLVSFWQVQPAEQPKEAAA